jgi:serine/threonine protein phosphatase 1
LADREDALICAIGDVHGQIGKLEKLLDRCERFAPGRAKRFVFIGDYIDRGPDSRAVVDLLINLQQTLGTRVVCLRGNHEAVIVAAARDRLDTLPGRVTMEQWIGENGGGAPTLASYGVAHARDVSPEHLAWMAALPLWHDDGRRFFAHAGVRPGRPLNDQQDDDLMWIREPFLSHTGDFGRLIVHGHTPTRTRVPDLRANRLNLDTAAGYEGPLTAAIFEAGEARPVAFISNAGELRPGDLARSDR